MVLTSAMSGVTRVRSVGALIALLAGCVGWIPALLDGGLSPLTQQVGDDGPTLRFEFELGDDAGSDEATLGAGYIVVSREGRELQALPHAFEMSKEAVLRDQWLTFQDFNGDGLVDFVVTRILAAEEDGGQAITSLYQMDAKIGKYVQVEPLSNVGGISAALRGCLELMFRDGRGEVRKDAYCYANLLSKWVRQPGLGGVDTPDLAQAGCVGVAAGVVACRKSRIELDRQLLVLVREARNGRRNVLQREVSRGYAAAYVRYMDHNHRIWLLYRDSSCTAQVREQAVPVGQLGAATESCRFEKARDQLTGYQKRLAQLATGLSQ